MASLTIYRKENLDAETLGELREYTAKRDFHFWDGSDPQKPRFTLNARRGDVFEYNQGVLVFLNRVYELENYERFESILAHDWCELTRGEEDPYIERMRLQKGLSKKPVKKQAEQQAPKAAVPQGPAKTVRGLVELVDGVEVLPADWDTKDWSFKRAYIMQMTDEGLLGDMLYDETERVQKFIQSRLDTLSGKAPAARPSAPAPQVTVNTEPAAKPESNKGSVVIEDNAPVPKTIGARAKRPPIPKMEPPRPVPKFSNAAEVEEASGVTAGDYDEEGEFIPVDFGEDAKAPIDPRAVRNRDKSGRRPGRPRKVETFSEESGTIELDDNENPFAVSDEDFEGPNGEPVEL